MSDYDKIRRESRRRRIESCKAGISYARWLDSCAFNKYLNKIRRESGLPEERDTVFLSEEGKRVYERELRLLRAFSSKMGFTLTSEAAERDAVRDALFTAMHRKD